MKQYIGIKVVAARPMTRGDYNIFRGWQIPADEDPADEGYVMKYENGHVQWLPKDMFESDYKEYDESTLPATAIGYGKFRLQRMFSGRVQAAQNSL